MMKTKPWTTKKAQRLQKLTREIIAEHGEPFLAQMVFQAKMRAANRVVAKPGFEKAYDVPCRFHVVKGRIMDCLAGEGHEIVQGLPAVHFADAESLENLVWLANWAFYSSLAAASEAAMRPPLVVIEGRTGTGKTTLLRWLFNEALKMQPANLARVKDLWHGNCPATGALVVENAKVSRSDALRLQHWVLAERIKARRCHSQRVEERVLSCVTILTVDEGFRVSKDLEWRVIRVRLGKR